MTIINAATNDQVLVATILPKIAQNNVNMVRLHVDFDSAWDSVKARSAVFTTSKRAKPYEVLFSAEGDCLVPQEVLVEEATLYIAVKGVNSASGTVKTSTRLTVRVLEGTPAVIVSDASPTAFEQLATANALIRERLENLIQNSGLSYDDEVIDARVDADGKTHDNAGNAIREQTVEARKNLKSIFENNEVNLFDPFQCIEDCAVYSNDGGYFDTTSYWCTKKLALNGARRLYCNNAVYKYAFYDADGSYISDASASSSYIKPIDVPDGAMYFIAQFFVELIRFDERFGVCIAESEHALSSKYKLPVDSVKGEIPALLGSLKKDEINRFDPMLCTNDRAMTDGGLLFKNASHWVTDFIDVNGCSYFEANATYYKAILYNAEGEFVSFVVGRLGLNKVDIPSEASYLRIQFEKAVVPFEERFSIIVNTDGNIGDCKPMYTFDGSKVDGLDALKGLLKTDRNNLFNPLKSFPALAFATANGAAFASEAYWVSDLIRVDGFTTIKSNVTIYKYGWYDSNKNILSVNEPAPAGAAFLRLQFAEAVVPYNSRFSIVVCDGAKEIAGVKPYYYLADDTDNDVGHIGQFKHTLQLTGTTYMSDHTFIGNRLYVINASSDDHAEYANVTVYDVDIENGTSRYVGAIQHNLGHANSIEYCAGNDCLILGNGSSDSSLAGKIFILPRVSTRTRWEYSDCIVIDVAGENWGIKTNVVWGEHNNGAYNIAYVITGNNAHVRKILLTKTGGEFDGGYIVLEEWHTNPIDVNQGTVYHNGKLYIGIGHSGLWMLEYTLNAGGNIAVKQHKDVFYDEAGNVLASPFTEGVTAKDGHILLGGSNGKIYVYKI